jgi:peptidoglycan-associated lipoprotein
MSARSWVSSTLVVVLCAMMATGCAWPWGKKKTSSTGLGTTDTVGTAGAGTTLVGETALPPRDLNAGKTAVTGQLEAIHFAYDSAQVEDTDRAKMEAAGEYLKANPAASMVLEGYCDERGSAEYNLSLGERRALSARAYLMNLGIDAARLQTKSLGMENPVDPAHTEEAWSKNRRVEFAVSKN